MRRKRKSRTREQVQAKESELKLPAERAGDLYEELLKSNLSGYDAVKFSLSWLERRFTAIRVSEVSEHQFALSTESGYEMLLKYDPTREILQMFLSNPGEIKSERNRCTEFMKIDGLKATMSFLDSSKTEYTLDRVLYWWFVMLSDYHEECPPEQGVA